MRVFRMTAEITLGDIPIELETDDTVMKEIFHLSDNEIVGNNPIVAKLDTEETKTEEKPLIQSTPKQLKQVS